MHMRTERYHREGGRYHLPRIGHALSSIPSQESASSYSVSFGVVGNTIVFAEIIAIRFVICPILSHFEPSLPSLLPGIIILQYRLLSVQRVPTVVVLNSATGQKVTPLGMEGIERAMAMTAGDDPAAPIDNLIDAWRVGGSGVGWTDQCLIT